MRKSGLHKQVSSIFDGAPSHSPPPQPSRSLLHRLSADGDASASAADADNHRDKPPAAVQEQAHAAPKRRPQPAPRGHFRPKTADTKKPRRGAGKKDGVSDAAKRQKIMTIMVGILSVVFVVVLKISLVGIGQSQATTVQADTQKDAAQAVSRINPQDWPIPDALPTQMRDPMVIEASVVEGDADRKTPISLIVRGIVYSDRQPSAIINDTIVFEGDTVGDVAIRSITRSTVEFEKEDRRWTQKVEN